MRATISFDIDVNEVDGAMGHLVSREADNLRAAADILEDYIAPRDHLLDEVTEALRLISEATSQLEQYRNMLVNFEKAKFETMIPQPAGQPVHNLGQLRETVESMKDLEGFLAGINNQEEDEEDDHVPEEG